MGQPRSQIGGYISIGSEGDVADSQAYAHKVLTLPTTFSLIYESCDGRLCLFEDAAGHLSAIDASRLA